MRTCIRALSFSLFVLIYASAASGVALDLVPIGSPGNATDPFSGSLYGSVGYDYSIGTYEVTNAQYIEFLNAKAATDPLGLYNVFMGSAVSQGGITRTGAPGTFTYTAIAGRAARPVNFVSFYDALRFANWMTNGQGAGDTETGAYTLTGGTAIPSNAFTLARTLTGPAYYLTSEDEWYKAAYYDSGSATYDLYTTGVSAPLPTCSAPTATPNTGNCGNAAGGPTSVGSYTGSPSSNGTYDQGGNVYEWNEAIIFAAFRGIRGGAYNNFNTRFESGNRQNTNPAQEFADVGFRLVLIPEPGTGLLLGLGLIGMAARRRAHAR